MLVVADRLANRVQLTTDGLKAYLEAVDDAFGAKVDCAMPVKLYGEAPGSAGRYSPMECTGAKKTLINGRPDKAHMSIGFVERQNLTMRMSMRRFMRITNAFSKKGENQLYALTLYFTFYNFVRMHKTIKCSSMAAGISKALWSMEDVVALIDPQAEPPKARGPYKLRAAKSESNSN